MKLLPTRDQHRNRKPPVFLTNHYVACDGFLTGNMVTCGHQLGTGDDDGWLLCSSAAAPVGGNHESNLLLRRIMDDLKLSNHDFFRSSRITLSVAKEREIKFQKHRDDRTNQRNKIDSFHDFSNFDETEHLDGCPVKWLFRRQSTGSFLSCGSNDKPVRDKIPKEIQIRKIGLKKRKNNKEKMNPEEGEKFETGGRNHHRAQLAAKLNFRPFSENNDEVSDDEKCQVPDRRPWLSVLLEPRNEIPSTRTSPKETPQSPTMSVRSLILPEIAKPRPKTTTPSSSAARWAGKKQPRDTKTLMIIPTHPHENHFIRIRRYEAKKGSKTSMQVISNRVQFSQRPGKPMR